MLVFVYRCPHHGRSHCGTKPCLICSLEGCGLVLGVGLPDFSVTLKSGLCPTPLLEAWTLRGCVTPDFWVAQSLLPRVLFARIFSLLGVSVFFYFPIAAKSTFSFSDSFPLVLWAMQVSQRKRHCRTNLGSAKAAGGVSLKDLLTRALQKLCLSMHKNPFSKSFPEDQCLLPELGVVLRNHYLSKHCQL